MKHFSQNIRAFFSHFWKSAGRPTPLTPFSCSTEDARRQRGSEPGRERFVRICSKKKKATEWQMVKAIK